MDARGRDIAIIAFFALLPFFSMALVYGDVTSKYLYLILGVDALLAYFAYELITGKRALAPGGMLHAALGLTILALILSAATGVFLDRSLWSDIFWMSGVVFLAHMAALAYLLGQYVSERAWPLLRTAVALSAGALGLLSLIGPYGFQLAEQVLFIPVRTSGLSLGNETYLGAYLLIGLLFGIGELFAARGTRRIALIVSSALILCSPLIINFSLLTGGVSLTRLLDAPELFLGLARSSSVAAFALIAFAAGYLVLRRLVKAKDVARAVLGWFALFLALIGGGIALLLAPGSFVQEAYIKAATAARPIAWEVGIDAFRERPFLGWGPENVDQAIERHFDSRLFEDVNLGEIWFERAHNVFIDTLIQVGIVGFAAFALLTVLYLLVVYRAWRKGIISESLFLIFASLVPLHLLQMQTGFDTVATYALLALALGYALSLERRMHAPERILSKQASVVAGVALALLVLISLKVAFLDEYTRIEAVFRTLHAKTASEQVAAIEASLARQGSFESLRMSYSSFLKGSLVAYAQSPTKATADSILARAHLYEGYFQKLLAAQPHDYRAHVNYAYLLLVMTGLGEDRVVDAKELITASYALSPGHPISLVLDSIAELYRGNIAKADQLMEAAMTINPDVAFTKEAAAYLARQKQQFPTISIVKIENL